MVRALLVLALVACELPDPKLVYFFSDNPAQSCGSTKCADIEIPCDAVMSLRISKPGAETTPIVTICEELPKNRNRDLCAIAQIDLAERPIQLPDETLEVQLVIWPRSEVLTEAGELDCAKQGEVQFDAVYGFPISQNPAPAIGGHTYYHPGDDEIRLTLGCTHLDSLRSCALSTDLNVSASVESFDSVGMLVDVPEGSSLDVAVGEPKLEGAATVYQMRNSDTSALAMVVKGFVPIWEGRVPLAFNDTACLQVIEDSAQATASVRCTDDNVLPPSGATLALQGTYIEKQTLDQILAALALSPFPSNGLTVGIVVDSESKPVGGVVVNAQPPAGTTAIVRYLSADRTTVTTGATSANGIFISQNAQFTTKFSVPGSAEEVGGQIQDKVTVVVIRKP